MQGREGPRGLRREQGGQRPQVQGGARGLTRHPGCLQHAPQVTRAPNIPTIRVSPSHPDGRGAGREAEGNPLDEARMLADTVWEIHHAGS